MVSTNLVPEASDEHLMEGMFSKVETVVQDECDLPVQVEESRNPSSSATTQEELEASPITLPTSDSSDAATTPTSDRMGGWFRRDGVEAAKPSSGNFWFRKQAQSEEASSMNRSAFSDLDERARKNEETGTSRTKQQNARWWRFGGGPAEPIDEQQNLNDFHRQYRVAAETQQEEDSPTSPPPEGSQNETAIVVRSESVNILWNVMSQAIRQSALWRAATRVQESSKAGAEQRAKQGAAMRHGIRKFFRRRNTEDQANIETEETETEDPAPRQPWWRRFRRNRSQAEESSVDGETSAALVPYGTGPHPIAAVMKKAAAGVTGTCMVIVGVPLLLFPVPGPGVAMIASGVYVVSTEFDFARSWLEKVKTRYGTLFDRLGIEVGAPEALPPPNDGTSSPDLTLRPSLPPSTGVDHEIIFSKYDEETRDSKAKESIDMDEDDYKPDARERIYRV